MTITLLDILIGGEVIIGVIGIFYPKFAFYYTHLWKHKKYDKKEENETRFWCFIGVLIGILMYIFMKSPK